MRYHNISRELFVQHSDRLHRIVATRQHRRLRRTDGHTMSCVAKQAGQIVDRSVCRHLELLAGGIVDGGQAGFRDVEEEVVEGGVGEGGGCGGRRR